MKIEQCVRSADGSWVPAPGRLVGAQVVLVFAAPELCRAPEPLEEVSRAYPGAFVVGCSTAGEIHGTRVSDGKLVATAVELEGASLQFARVDLDDVPDSEQAGRALTAALDPEGLRHLLVFSEGIHVNGSRLVQGMTAGLPAGVTVTGGLSGDGERFERTSVIWDGAAESHTVVAVALYGERLRVGYASLGGWDPFGPERLITRSEGNVLYELDGRSALELYKTYLGEHASGLPATGLLFPLSLRTAAGDTGVVRTILAVDEGGQSMTFAGDVPEGSYAQLMKANFDRLIDGAVGAARTSYQAVGGSAPDLALLISCVGRKMVLGQRVEEEVEGVRDVMSPESVFCGFYSYGEISPFTPDARCELHNQTMTITTFSER